jgi:hypothetical protein
MINDGVLVNGEQIDVKIEQDPALQQFSKGQAMGHRVLENFGVPPGSKMPTWKFEGGTPTWPMQLVWRPERGSTDRAAPVAKFTDDTTGWVAFPAIEGKLGKTMAEWQTAFEEVQL